MREVQTTDQPGELLRLYDSGMPEVYECLGRTEGATEQLLVRARAAFRERYEHREEDR